MGDSGKRFRGEWISMNTMLFKAPAKINLCLHVLGRRPDGYHELAMAMQPVSLVDDVVITVGRARGVRVSCAGVGLADGEENIAARAAALILAESGADVGVDVDIVKRIPVAAGLGGGSSDAAAVLLGLNEMLGLKLTGRELRALGGRLGADVPFFVEGGAAWATGIGTRLEPLGDLPDVAYLLVNPGIGVSTASVYKSLELTKGGQLANLPRFSVVTRDDLCRSLHNDLERVVLTRHPEIADIKRTLVAYGALGALMSGSGATVFGVFEDYDAAARIGEILAQETGWKVFPVRPLRGRL